MFGFRTFFAIAALLPATLAQTVTYEAEEGTLSGTTIGNTVSGYSGTGYVESFDDSGDTLTITVTSETEGLFDLSIIYAAPNGEKYTSVSLNGEGGSQVYFKPTETFATAAGGQVLLKAGENTIAFQTNWGWYLIDAITLTPTVPRPPHNIPATPVNSATTQAAKTLLKYLIKNYGSFILSGQQELSGVTWIEENIGKTPAILGLDLMDYSPSRVEHGTTSQAIEEAIAWDKRGGIVTFCWHWNAPTGLYDVEGSEWWSGFYTRATDFDVSTALADTTNANYTLLIRDIDAIAVQLKRLQDADVPVLWRPLHEADGAWFWWGAKGAEPCKKLWDIVYERLTTHHKLNNLIWTWNSVSEDWYPGDETVDIVSFDSYPATAGDHSPVSTQYNQLYELGNAKKLIALTENGAIPDPDLLQLYEADWSWFVTWTGEFVENGVHNSKEFLQKVFNHDYVKNLDDITGWKSDTTGTAKPNDKRGKGKGKGKGH